MYDVHAYVCVVAASVLGMKGTCSDFAVKQAPGSRIWLLVLAILMPRSEKRLHVHMCIDSKKADE